MQEAILARPEALSPRPSSISTASSRTTPRTALRSPTSSRKSLPSCAKTAPRDQAAGRTTQGVHRTDLKVIHAPKGLPADQCSTGEQKALLIGLILANAQALFERDFAPSPLLLLDEAAAHLDSDRRAALVR